MARDRAAAFERFSRAVDGPMMVLALAMIPLIVVPLVADLSPATERAVLAVDYLLWAVFAADERAQTTFALLAECFEELGGVPKVVLADRMACLKGGGVANVVVPTPDYVQLATHYLLTELTGA